MAEDTFDVLILIGRPASGKSEIIKFLTHLPDHTRRERFHIAHLDVLDDFPILWGWFEEDNILSRRFGLPRLHNDEQGYFQYQEFWHVLIELLDLDYAKKVRDNTAYHDHTTALLEFSRGSQHGGYRQAFRHVSAQLLKRAGVVYVCVPFEESLRKNRRRFNPHKPDSVLEHGLTDEQMERLYREDDWTAVAPGDSGYLSIDGQNVPYVVFPNEDDVTTGQSDQLALRLESVLGNLWDLYQHR
ncbi:MAG TPA: hypothetical protein VK206_27160 [Anaerolineales bacterium]|nr:hypothetical protein [Anaerolineales bacterium]HLO32610.1 hypothetical protein [Anaerolineales bacterium]